MIHWQNQVRPIILASGSPRRKQILEQMGLTITVEKPLSIDEEEHLDSENIEGSIQRLAAIKAQLIAQRNPESLVIGADTIVVKDQQILGKPSDRDHGRRMLNLLSNGRHTVMTGVAIRCEARNYIDTAVECTDVYFRSLSDIEINQYLEHDEYTDKAGAYAIQGKAMIFIEKITGCYYNVVGLPVARIIYLLKDFIVRKESADV